MKPRGAAVIAAGAVLAGCGGSADLTAASSGPPSAAIKSAYLQVVRTYLPARLSDGQLLAFGHGICREFDDDFTWTAVLAGLVTGGMDAQKAGGAIATSVAAFCPDHRSDLP